MKAIMYGIGTVALAFGLIFGGLWILFFLENDSKQYKKSQFESYEATVVETGKVTVDESVENVPIRKNGHTHKSYKKIYLFTWRQNMEVSFKDKSGKLRQETIPAYLGEARESDVNGSPARTHNASEMSKKYKKGDKVEIYVTKSGHPNPTAIMTERFDKDVELTAGATDWLKNATKFMFVVSIVSFIVSAMLKDDEKPKEYEYYSNNNYIGSDDSTDW